MEMFGINFFDFDEIINNSLLNGYKEIKHTSSKDDNNYYIEMSLPGFTKKDLKINYENNLLSVSSDIEDKWKFKFNKTFKISQSINAEKIKADLNDGILKITIPKDEKTKLLNICIN